MYIKTIFTTVISCDIYSLDIHFLLKTKQSQKLHYCSKLESDGFHSSNLAIALLIGICMYIFSLLHLMMTVLDALPSLNDIRILHNNRLNDYELTGPFEIRQKPWNFDQSLTVIIYTHQSRGAPCGSPRTMIP